MPERFSDRTYAAPFGRFEADAEAESPANEVLVGREGQRAYFIDILLRSGRRGAFLVTGNRGVGKSSFVRYCLREYEEEVFERFLRGNVGRTTFWDRIVVLSLFFAAPLVLLMISEFMELVTLAAVGSRAHFGSSPASFLALLVILPLFIFAIYPLLFGWEALSQVYATRFPRRKASTLAFVTTAGLIAATWGLSPFGAPALSVSRLFCILAGLYLWVRCSSFHAPPPLATEPATWGRRERRRRYLHRWLFGHPGWFALFAAIPLVLGIAPFRYLDWTRKLFSSNDTTTSFRSFWGNLAIGLMLLGMGAFLHGLHLRRQPDLGGAVHDPSKRLLRRSGGATYIFGGLLVALFAAAVLRTQDLFTLVFALGVCLSSLAAFG
ncbi:MAG TPA: ATP-binding protein, partial [Thermoanaerobaculia bacterium]|nr:ATP-binding protein [Thermoanaerobaculia bacterium]